MIEEYKTIINKILVNNYEQVLIIDVNEDKIYKYINNNGNFMCNEGSSYVEYFNTCKNFIYEDDIQDYIDSLSISKLEESNSKITLNYKMFNEKLGGYMDYVNNISLYNYNGKKLIVVLVSLANGSVVHEKTDYTKSNLENKINKLVDAVSLAMLKIHNVINMDNNLRTKDEYINSILVGLVTDYPELNKSFNDNASEVYNSGKSTIMIIDDDKMTCNLIGKIFNNDYDIVMANNGEEAINMLKSCKNNGTNISCIFLDLIMPVLDGFSVLDYLSDNNYLNKMPVIIISGNYDKETRKKAYSYAIADMLEKPFNAQVIRHRIENLISLYRSSGILNEMMLEQHEDLKQVVKSIVSSYELDNSNGLNILKRYMKILSMQMSVLYPEYGINSNMIDKLSNSVIYYGIGKYTLPKSLLLKRGTYTEEEINILKSSNINGASIVKHVLSNNNNEVDPKYCYEIAKCYNERYDGTGYPEGLSGDSIPLSSQIASLVIEYYNLVNTMVPVDYNRIASLIIMEAGHKFNAKVVEAFKMVQSEFESITKGV